MTTAAGQCVDEVTDTNSAVTELQSDIDFLSPLQRVTSLDDVINADAGDTSLVQLVRGEIVTKPSPSWGSGRHRRNQPSAPCPRWANENLPARSPRRSLFGRRAGPPTSTPLRDVGNTTPMSSRSCRRCVSDQAADCGRERVTATPLTKTQSMSAAVLSAVVDNDQQRLVGDFTRKLCLPVVDDSKHCDLNVISHETVYSIYTAVRISEAK